MAGPQHGILGGGSSPLDLPQVDNSVKTEDDSGLRSAAAFTKTDEFRQLKELVEAKIAHWQQFVPGASREILAGDRIDVSQLGNEERGWRWLAADAVIHELSSIISAYEQSVELVKDRETTK